MIERSRRVVLLIDYDNLQICASRDTPGRELQLTPVVQLAQHYGTVILARAYAEWNLSTERLAVYKAGIEPAFAPVLRTESDRSGKSLADTVMVAEGMDMLWTLSPEVVVLATSDKDLIPLVRVAKQRGAFVVVLGSDFTAIPLREMADEHVTYKQLITDTSGRYVNEAGPARPTAALPEPARRRPRERNGRERVPITPAPATPASAAIPPSVRVEREQPAPGVPSAPAVAAGSNPAASTSAVEPVAPLTGDADSQGLLGRRRRRRGSRRRSERIGGFGEGMPSAEGGSDADELYADGPEAEDTEETEAAKNPAAEELSAVIEVAPAEIVEVLGTPIEEAPSAPSGPDPEFAPPVAAPPRDRRRRARRPVPAVAAAEAEVAPAAGDEQGGAAPPTGEASPVDALAPAPVADILWADAPASVDGQAAPADAEPAPASEAPAAEAPVASPRPRPRRVASAARGRTRPASSR